MSVYLCLSTCFFLFMSNYLCLSIYVCLYMSNYLCLSIYVCKSMSVSISTSEYLSMSVYTCLSSYLCLSQVYFINGIHELAVKLVHTNFFRKQFDCLAIKQALPSLCHQSTSHHLLKILTLPFLILIPKCLHCRKLA